MAITLGDLIVRIRGEQKELDGDLDQAERKVQGTAGKMGGFFSGALQHAVGGAILGGIQQIGGAIMGAVGDAWNATKSYESMGAALNTLLAKEIQDQSVQTKRIPLGMKTIEVTEGGRKATLKKGESEADLAFKIQQTNNQIALQNEHLQEAIAKGKESATEIEARRLRIQALEGKLSDLNARTSEAGTVTSKQVMAYKEEKTAAIDIITARKMAAEKTKELLDWSQKLAVNSPFGQEDVIKSVKLGMALGYTSDQTKRMTQANINFASATGAEGAAMERITLALGQMQAKGKLAGGEMLQLTEAGVPMREILLESGKVAGLTAANFDKMQAKGLIPAKAAYEAYVEYVEKNFGTAAQDQANTLAGLENSFGDLKNVVLRTALEPVFKAVQPYLIQFVTALQDPNLQASIKAIGDGLGKFVAGAFQKIGDLVGAFSKGGVNGLLGALGLTPAQIGFINAAISTITGIVQGLVAFFVTNLPVAQAAGTNAFNGITGAIGSVVSFVTTYWPTVQAIILGVFQQVQTWVTTNWPPIQATILAVFQQVSAWITTNWPVIQAYILTAFQSIVNWITTNWPAIQQTITDVFNAIVFAFNTWVVPMFNFLLAQAAVIIAWFQENWPLIQRTAETVFTAIGNVIQLFVGIIQGVLQVGLPPLIALVNGAFTSIKAVIETAINLVLGIIRTVMLILTGDWSGAWETIKQTAMNVWEGIKKFFEGIPAAMIKLGKDLMDGLIEGFKQKANAVKDALLAILPPAIRELLRQMGIASPSRVMIGISNDIVDGLIMPFAERAREVREAMTSMMERAVQAANKAAANAVQAGQDLHDRINMNTPVYNNTAAALDAHERHPGYVAPVGRVGVAAGEDLHDRHPGYIPPTGRAGVAAGEDAHDRHPAVTINITNHVASAINYEQMTRRTLQLLQEA